MNSQQFVIKTESDISYYEDTRNRSLKQLLLKVKNTVLAFVAYRFPSNKIRVVLHRMRGVHIGKHVYIGTYCVFDNLYPSYIYIEDYASVNAGTMILTHFNPMRQYAPILQARVAPVLIKKKAIVAVRSTILPGVEIGECSIVSAGSVVEKSVPDYTLVKGVPAKKVIEYELLLKH